MEIEHAVKVFPLGPTLEDDVRKMTAEGYMLIPGVVPVAVYHVVRIHAKPGENPPPKPMAKIQVDDTKVKILRNGELIDGA